MDGEQIFSAILMTFIGLLCAGMFYGIGVWACKRTDPAGFYTGTMVDPKTIRDIPAYNRENGKLWKIYSIPFWLVVLCGILSFWIPEMMGVAVVMIGLSCTVGIGWLIWMYHRILKKYKI